MSNGSNGSTESSRSQGAQDATGPGGSVRSLVLRPGVRVLPEHRQALAAAGVKGEVRTPSVGVVEVWASWVRLGPDGSLKGAPKVRRTEPEEATRLEELSRIIDAGEGQGEPSADDRARLEAIAQRMNADLLAATEELANLSRRGRAALVRRALSAMDGAPGACNEDGLASLVGRVKNDDLGVSERTRHAVLWLLLRDRNGGVAASDTSGEVLYWLLDHEDHHEGLTGVLGACDDLYREVTGHRPSSTVASRLDRASALRCVLDATRVPLGTVARAEQAQVVASSPAPTEGRELAKLRDENAAMKARVVAAERALKDAQDTTRQLSDEVGRLSIALEEARRDAGRARDTGGAWRGAPADAGKARVEEREPPTAALTPGRQTETGRTTEPARAPEPGAPILKEPALTERPDVATQEPLAAEELDDGFFGADVPLAIDVAEPVDEPPQQTSRRAPAPERAAPGPKFSTAQRPSVPSFMDEHLGGGGRLRAFVVAAAVVLLVSAAYLFLRNTDPKPEPEVEPVPSTASPVPEPTRKVRETPLPVVEAAPDAGAEVVEIPGEEVPAVEAGAPGEIPEDEPHEADPAEGSAAIFKARLMLSSRSKVFIQGVKRPKLANELEGEDVVIDECVLGEVAPGAAKSPVYRGYTPVRLVCDGKFRDFCRSLGCSDDAIVCYTNASAVSECSPQVPVDPWEGVAPDEVSGSAPAGFKPELSIRKTSKVYARGSGDAVLLDTLPGGLEVDNRCVFAASSKEKTHRRAYPGYEHLAIHCAGPKSALCKALGCGAPGELCHLVASGVKPCKP